MKTLLSLAGILFLFLLIIPVPLVADGCFVWTNEKIDILEPEQKAFMDVFVLY